MVGKKIINRNMMNEYAIRPRGCINVHFCFVSISLLNFDSINDHTLICSLGDHQRDDSGASPDIEHRIHIFNGAPRTNNNCVSSNFMGRVIVPDRKLFEMKILTSFHNFAEATYKNRF